MDQCRSTIDELILMCGLISILRRVISLIKIDKQSSNIMNRFEMLILMVKFMNYSQLIDKSI